MPRIKVFALLLALLFCPVGWADYFDGNALMNQLIGSDRDVDQAMFRGYVAGVQDPNNGNLFCVPPEVRLSQSAAIVKNYFEANPKHWHRAASALVISALEEAYPCPR